MVEVCRAITKHHYLVQDARDIARVVKEAFHIAGTGRPGPVLIDMPKDIQNTLCPDADFDPPIEDEVTQKAGARIELDLDALLAIPRSLGYKVEYRRAERPAALTVG